MNRDAKKTVRTVLTVVNHANLRNLRGIEWLYDKEITFTLNFADSSARIVVDPSSGWVKIFDDENTLKAIFLWPQNIIKQAAILPSVQQILRDLEGGQ